MGLLDKALNIGEGKQFREYEKRVSSIGAWEEELTELDDAGLRAETGDVLFRRRGRGATGEVAEQPIAGHVPVVCRAASDAVACARVELVQVLAIHRGQ